MFHLPQKLILTMRKNLLKKEEKNCKISNFGCMFYFLTVRSFKRLEKEKKMTNVYIRCVDLLFGLKFFDFQFWFFYINSELLMKNVTRKIYEGKK